MRNTPSALAWLANKRARVAFDLSRTEAVSVEINERLVRMRLDLAGLDRTIRVFDANLDPLKIELIQEHRYRAPRGALRSAILQTLRDGSPDWLGTDVIEAIVIAKLALVFDTKSSRKRWYDNVFRKQLKRFVAEGIAQRIYDPANHRADLGTWRFNPRDTPTLNSLRSDLLKI